MLQEKLWFECGYCRTKFRAENSECPGCGSRAVEYGGESVRHVLPPGWFVTAAAEGVVSTSSAIVDVWGRDGS